MKELFLIKSGNYRKPVPSKITRNKKIKKKKKDDAAKDDALFKARPSRK